MQKINENNTRPWGVGGSDIGAIVGLSPYRSAVDVWLDKLGRRCKGDEAIHLRYGRHLEPFVTQEYERVTGNKAHSHPTTVLHPEHPHLFAHVDGLVSCSGEPVVNDSGQPAAKILLECKTASAFTASHWGAQWTDEVPATYVAQCVWYMAMTGCEEAHLAVLLGNSDFRVYRVMQDDKLAAALIKAALDFWDGHVLAGEPPKPRTREDVELVHPVHVRGKDVEADEQLLQRIRKLQRLSRLSKRIEVRERELGAQVTERMRDAERVCSNGQPLVTWRSSSPTRRVDLARLRRERPELVGLYTSVGKPPRRFTLLGVKDE